MSSPNNQRGFTLVEVLIAIVILATGILLMIESMGRSQQAIRIADNLVRGSLLLDQKLTDLEMEVRDRHRLSYGNSEGKLRQPGKEFSWQTYTRPYHDDSVLDQTKINQSTISVKWKEAGNRSNELTFESLILNHEKKKE